MFLVDKNSNFGIFSDVFSSASVSWTAKTSLEPITIKFDYNVSYNLLNKNLSVNIHDNTISFSPSNISCPNYVIGQSFDSMYIIVDNNTTDDIITYEGFYLSEPILINFGDYLNNVSVVNHPENYNVSSRFEIEVEDSRVNALETYAYVTFKIKFNNTTAISKYAYNSIVPDKITTKYLEYDMDVSSAIYTNTPYTIENKEYETATVSFPSSAKFEDRGGSASTTLSMTDFTTDQQSVALSFPDPVTPWSTGSGYGSITCYGTLAVNYYEATITSQEHKTYKFVPVCIPVLSCIV